MFRWLLIAACFTAVRAANDSHLLRAVVRKDNSLAHFSIDTSFGAAGEPSSGRAALSQRPLVAHLQPQTPVFTAYLSHNATLLFSVDGLLHSLHLPTLRSDLLGRLGPSTEHQPTTAALDWITEKMYVGVSSSSPAYSARILACEWARPAQCAVLLHDTLAILASLTLDPIDGVMYWINRDANRIEKAWMSGRHHDRHPYADSVSSGTMSSLCLHHELRSLFYVRTQVDGSTIWKCKLYDRASCVKVLHTEHIAGLAIVKGALVWSTQARGEVHLCDAQSPIGCDKTTIQVAESRNVESLLSLEQEEQPPRSSPNPCGASNGGCSDMCVLVQHEPWFECVCRVGVRLSADAKTCRDGIDKVLLVSSVSGLFYISLDTPDYTPQLLPYQGHESEPAPLRLLDVDYDPVDGAVYWIDAQRKTIRTASFHGGPVTDMIRKEVSVSSRCLRVDPLSRNLFWLNRDTGKIMMSSLNGSWVRTLLGRQLSHPNCMALDTDNGWIYVTDESDSSSSIRRVRMDGSQVETILTLSNSVAVGVEVDPSAGRLYWTEANGTVIHSSDLVGMRRHEYKYSSQSFLQPFSISKLGSTVYANSLAGRQFVQFEMLDKERFSQYRASSLADSVIYGSQGIRAVQLKRRVSPGRCTKAACSHLCVQLSHNTTRCMCPSGFDMDKAGRTCEQPAASVLVLGQHSQVSRVSLSAPLSREPLYLPDLPGRITAIDVDQSSSHVVVAGVSDVKAFIARASLDGAESRVLLEGEDVHGVHSVAVDWLSGNVYWTNPILGRVEVVDSTGTFRRAIAWKGVVPASIVVSPLTKHVIFADLGKNNTIKRMPLSGDPEGGEDIVGDLWTVRSLTIDYAENRLYWTDFDGEASRVSSCKLDGSQRESLWMGEDRRPDRIFHHNLKLYYTDPILGEFGVFTGRTFSPIHDSVGEVTALSILHATPPRGGNECSVDNGGCPQLCLSTMTRQRRAHCVCQDHFHFDPNTGKCLAPDNVIVMAGEGAFYMANLRLVSGRKVSWTEDPIVRCAISGVGRPVSIGYDMQSRHRTVYWVDSLHPGFLMWASEATAGQIETHRTSLSQYGCSLLYAVAVDLAGRQLFVSCDSERRKGSKGAVHVWRIQWQWPLSDSHLVYVGAVVSDADDWRAASIAPFPPAPTRIALFPAQNFLFYLDTPVEGDAKIVQCELNGRKCVVWYDQGLSSSTRLHADPANLRLIYTCRSGVWSRDIGMASVSVWNHHSVGNVSDFLAAPIDEQTLMIGEMTVSSFRLLDSSSPADSIHVPASKMTAIEAVGRAGVDPDSVAREACLHSDCSHMCRQPSDSRHKFHCDCPIGYAPSKHNPHSCEQNVLCQLWEFRCADGLQCVHAASKCDQKVDCSDGSDEWGSVCGAVPSHLHWPCEDGDGAIDRILLCDGRIDCADGSDERRCKCTHPSEQLDCKQWPVRRMWKATWTKKGTQPSETDCVDRQLFCSDLDECENGLEKNTMLCGRFTAALPDSPEWVYVSLLALVLALTALLLGCCCMRRATFCAPTVEQAPMRYGDNAAEASILLPPIAHGQHVTLALRTYSVAASGSSYPPLPPPHSEASSFPYAHRALPAHPPPSLHSDYSVFPGGVVAAYPTTDIPLNRFYAPPPSAASLSTYGVVKPRPQMGTLTSRRGEGERIASGDRCADRERRRKERLRRERAEKSPPPGYTTHDLPETSTLQKTLLGDVSGNLPFHPTDCSTPKRKKGRKHSHTAASPSSPSLSSHESDADH